MKASASLLVLPIYDMDRFFIIPYINRRKKKIIPPVEGIKKCRYFLLESISYYQISDELN